LISHHRSSTFFFAGSIAELVAEARGFNLPLFKKPARTRFTSS
jgi:hypothetical protein